MTIRPIITEETLDQARQDFYGSLKELEQQRPDPAALRETAFGSDEDEDFDPERFVVAGDA
jgi:hypothetical protein